MIKRWQVRRVWSHSHVCSSRKILVLLLRLEGAPHTSIRVCLAWPAHTSGERDVSRSAASISAHADLGSSYEIQVRVIKVVVHQVIDVYAASTGISSGVRVRSKV